MHDQSLLNRLEQGVAGVGVELDVDSGGHVVAEVEQLTAAGDGHWQRGGSLFDGDLGDGDGVVDRLNRTAEVDLADNDQAAAGRLLEQCRAQGGQRGNAELGAGLGRVEGSQLDGKPAAPARPGCAARQSESPWSGRQSIAYVVPVTRQSSVLHKNLPRVFVQSFCFFGSAGGRSGAEGLGRGWLIRSR